MVSCGHSVLSWYANPPQPLPTSTTTRRGPSARSAPRTPPRCSAMSASQNFSVSRLYSSKVLGAQQRVGRQEDGVERVAQIMRDDAHEALAELRRAAQMLLRALLLRDVRHHHAQP